MILWITAKNTVLIAMLIFKGSLSLKSLNNFMEPLTLQEKSESLVLMLIVYVNGSVQIAINNGIER
ncbi:hypothetical protein U719_02275 [Exiguobacterium sp. MH3]|nr:hypothetical protein U719_02275 [Exiguobacterium sp. MH3]